MKKIADMTSAEIVAEYNQIAPKKVSRFENRATAERRLQEARDRKAALAPRVGSAANETKATVNPDKPKTIRTAGLPGPRSQHTGQKIYKLVDKNPRRVGTHGYKSFELIKDGMTYEAYRLAGGRTNDLAWDIDHGYVEMR